MSDSEPLRFACPTCGQHIECTTAWAGVELDCPACAKPFRAPSPARAAMPCPVPASSRPPPLPVSCAPKTGDPAARSLRSWTEHAGTYAIIAPVLMLALGAATYPVRDRMEGVVAELAAVLVLFLFVSGCLAAFTALVHCFLGGKGFPKALFGIAINLLLAVYMIVPASHRAWHRHKEIQW